MGSRRFPQSGAGPTQRMLRAGELIRHALVDIMAREDFRDPDLIGVSVTIGEVRTSPDLKHANVFCARLGGGDATTLAKALNRASGFLRARLAREVELKYTPMLHFIPDTSYDDAEEMETLLRSPEVARDTRSQSGADASDGEEE